MKIVSRHHRELSALTEIQRAQALKRFQLIHLFLQEGVPLTTLASSNQLSVRTLRRFVQQYRTHGLAGLMRASRKDQGQMVVSLNVCPPTEHKSHLVDNN